MGKAKMLGLLVDKAEIKADTEQLEQETPAIWEDARKDKTICARQNHLLPLLPQNLTLITI